METLKHYARLELRLTSLLRSAMVGLCFIALNQAPLTHYVIVRQDLPLGFLAAQVVHAAGESACGPVPVGTHAVVLAVRDELELRQVASRLASKCVKHAMILEVDAPYAGQATAIGISPLMDRSVVRDVVRRLKLLGKEVASES